MKQSKQIKKRGTWASYRDDKNENLYRCDIDELAHCLLRSGEVPQTITNTRAFELRLLAEAYLDLRKRYERVT